MLRPEEEVLFNLNGIQDLPYQPNLMGVHGQIGHGKDTFHKHVTRARTAHHMSFANPLKLALQQIIGCDLRFYFGTQEQKAQPLPKFWLNRLHEAWLKLHPEQADNPTKWETFRESMQLFGTEVGRELIAELIWVWSIEFKIMEGVVKGHIGPTDMVVFADCRFQNEAKAILGWGGHVFEVRNGNILNQEADFGTHESENRLPPELITESFTCFSVEENNAKADYVLKEYYT